MPLIPANLWPHITIDEINSLSEDESFMLLYICNVWAPIKPPIPTEEDPHPITLNLIRYSKKESIIDRIKQSEPNVKEEFKEIYNGIKTKLKIQ
jgi:hypothetical protein